MDLTQADTTLSALALLQVLLDAFSLAHEEWNMVLGVLHELIEDFHFLLEIFDKLVVFLISPGVAERNHLAMYTCDLRL